MNTESNILTECFVDTLIIQTVISSKKEYNHQKGCNNVLKRMRIQFADKAAFGIIDDDKIVANFNAFSLLKKHNEHLAIYRHSDKPHYIIKIGKAVEDFIIHCAEQCDVSLADYNLPTDLNTLKKRTKRATLLNDNDFKKLFSALQKNNKSDFRKLEQWIELFKANPYHVKVESL
ncbi:MAG: hypothetical protein LBE56_00035 [Tannerella sp.]|jgi:hypothetical protein|nr:hypothetical protein [Tannerella sp.]